MTSSLGLGLGLPAWKRANVSLPATFEGVQAKLALLDSGDTATKLKVLCIGDSLTESYGITDEANSWPSKFGDELRSRLGLPASGSRFYSAVNFGTMPEPWVRTGTVGDNALYGFGHRCVTLSHNGTNPTGDVTLTFTGTGLDLYWTGAPTLTTMRYNIDSGATIGTVVQNAAEYAGANIKNCRKTEIRGLAPGVHTVKIDCSVSGTIVFEGAYVYNGDENYGVHVINAGHSGWSHQASMPGNTANLVVQATSMPMTSFQPDLVFVTLGINDWRALDEDEAVFRTYIYAHLSALRSAWPSAAIIMPLEHTVSPTGGEQLTWEYVKGLIREAADDFNALTPSIDDYTGSFVPPLTNPYDIDGAHMTDAGYAKLGESFAGYVWDRVWSGSTFRPTAVDTVIPVEQNLTLWTPVNTLTVTAAGTTLADGSNVYNVSDNSASPEFMQLDVAGLTPGKRYRFTLRMHTSNFSGAVGSNIDPWVGIRSVTYTGGFYASLRATTVPGQGNWAFFSPVTSPLVQDLLKRPAPILQEDLANPAYRIIGVEWTMEAGTTAVRLMVGPGSVLSPSSQLTAQFAKPVLVEVGS